MNFTIPSTSKTIITIVIATISINATVGVGALSTCLILGLKPETGLVTAFVALTSGLVGALTGLLANTRTSPGTDADLPKATVVVDKPTV